MLTVAKAFTTRHSRFAAGQAIRPDALKGDAMTLGDRLQRGFLSDPSAPMAPAFDPLPPPEPAPDPEPGPEPAPPPSSRRRGADA